MPKNERPWIYNSKGCLRQQLDFDNPPKVGERLYTSLHTDEYFIVSDVMKKEVTYRAILTDEDGSHFGGWTIFEPERANRYRDAWREMRYSEEWI